MLIFFLNRQSCSETGCKIQCYTCKNCGFLLLLKNGERSEGTVMFLFMPAFGIKRKKFEKKIARLFRSSFFLVLLFLLSLNGFCQAHFQETERWEHFLPSQLYITILNTILSVYCAFAVLDYIKLIALERFLIALERIILNVLVFFYANFCLNVFRFSFRTFFDFVSDFFLLSFFIFEGSLLLSLRNKACC